MSKPEPTTSPPPNPAATHADARCVRLLVLDVDGVLTDGAITLSDHGVETKRYHAHDGCGLRIWQRLGGEIAVITGRAGMSLRHRLEELGIRHLINGSLDKGRDFDRLCAALGVAARDAAMLGDDLPDLPVLRRCGYPMAVRDAAAEVVSLARFVTSRPGGHGAVRDAVEHLLTRQGRWQEAVALYDSASASQPAEPSV